MFDIIIAPKQNARGVYSFSSTPRPALVVSVIRAFK